MTERLKILIIDDDKTWQAFLSAALQDNYDVKTAANGELGLAVLADWTPDTILLDIEMPVKNGYETCKALKENPNTESIPVIFLSSKVSLQEKISGFQLGADDYLVKPCEAEILNAKVTRSTALYRERLDLDRKAEGAQVLAFEAMNSSADLGRTLRFAERTYAMHSFDKLAEGLFQTMAEFGLDCSVMFVTSQGSLFYAQNKHELSPLEQDMFHAIHQEGRFCDFGCRTFCNFKLVSLLIKNMPLENPERYGRIKDCVPWILGPADGKVGALDVHNILVAQHSQVTALVAVLQQKLAEVTAELAKSNDVLAVNTEAMFRDTQALRASTGGIGKDEFLDDGVEKSYHHILDSLARNNQLNAQISTLMEMLTELEKQQENVNEVLIKESNAETAMELGSDEIFSSDVDFF